MKTKTISSLSFCWNIISLVSLALLEFFVRTSIWLFQDKFSSISAPRSAVDFRAVTKYSPRLIFRTVKFSLSVDLKSNNFVFDLFRELLFTLNYSVTNFSYQ